MPAKAPSRSPVIRFKRLRPGAIIPRKGTDGAAGFDLFAVVEPGQGDGISVSYGDDPVPTGIAVEIPPGYALLLRGRSGLARQGVTIHHGTIDSDYRGEIGVLMRSANGPHRVRQGDAIAQVLLVATPDCVWEEAEELSATERGVLGYGSTGR